MAENLTMDDVLTFIDNMKVLELAEFVKKIEDRYGVTAAAAMPVAVAGASAGGVAAATRNLKQNTRSEKIRFFI